MKTKLLATEDKSGELFKAVKKAVAKSNGKYSSVSHFVRVAVSKLIETELMAREFAPDNFKER